MSNRCLFAVKVGGKRSLGIVYDIFKRDGEDDAHLICPSSNARQVLRLHKPRRLLRDRPERDRGHVGHDQGVRALRAAGADRAHRGEVALGH